MCFVRRSEHAVLACCPGEQGWLIPGDDTAGEVTSFIEAEDHEHFKVRHWHRVGLGVRATRWSMGDCEHD